MIDVRALSFPERAWIVADATPAKNRFESGTLPPFLRADGSGPMEWWEDEDVARFYRTLVSPEIGKRLHERIALAS